MLNKAIITGRLTADVELRHTPGNIAVTSFVIACDRDYVKAGAERETDFIDVLAWRNTAEFIARNFRKGNAITITGRIQTRNYTDNAGNKRKGVELVAEEVYFCGRNDNNKTVEEDSDGALPF